MSTAHSTVACLVTWPSSGSEAGIDFVLIQSSLLLYVDNALLLQTSLKTMKSTEVCIKTKSIPASFPLKGQAAKHTPVWCCLSNVKRLFCILTET